jgi:hypothetical protein
VTHDELLADINKYCSDIESGLRWEPDYYIKALRAVVELHRPAGNYCFSCIGENANGVLYPCPTIEVIEKGLL